jgi:hypothetical protein
LTPLEDLSFKNYPIKLPGHNLFPSCEMGHQFVIEFMQDSSQKQTENN